MGAGIPRLAVQNSAKTLPGVITLDDVAFDVLSGEIRATAAENGAGNSTLTHIIAGSGEVDGDFFR